MRQQGSGGSDSTLQNIFADKSGSFDLRSSSSTSGNDFNVEGRNGVSVQIEGTFTGTLYVWGSVDGENFKKCKQLTDIESGTAFNGTTDATIAIGNIAGLKKMRVTGVDSGKATITWRATR